METDSAAESALAREYRLERLTWIGLVGILIASGLLPSSLALHKGLAPLAAGGVLLLSAALRIRRSQRGAYSSLIASLSLFALAGVNFLSRPHLDLSLLAALVVIAVIGASLTTRAPGAPSA